MNPQLITPPYESTDLFNCLNTPFTSNDNLSCSSTHSNLESSSLSPYPRTSPSTHITTTSTTTTRRLIHSSFIELKKTLGLTSFQRKTQIDSLLKKCKSKAFKSIHAGLRQCFTTKLQRLPQEFITNIKIDFNKKFLSKTIIEIYKENNALESFDEMMSKGMIKDNKALALKEFLSLKLNEVFEYYVNSKQFIKDYNHVIEREGEKFALLFYFISNVFIRYYTQTKGNRVKGEVDGALGNKCNYGKEVEVKGKGNRDIFLIEKCIRDKEKRIDLVADMNKTKSMEQCQLNKNGNESHCHCLCYLIPSTEQFAPISIIENEKLI